MFGRWLLVIALMITCGLMLACDPQPAWAHGHGRTVVAVRSRAFVPRRRVEVVAVAPAYSYSSRRVAVRRAPVFLLDDDPCYDDGGGGDVPLSFGFGFRSRGFAFGY